jgi:cation diffusion facilitator CzcD-associated flavoprotein CzcO
VHAHDLSGSSLTLLTKKGLLTSNGAAYKLAAVVLVPSFFSRTGPMTCIDTKNGHGFDLEDVWADGTTVYIGMPISGFPNIFVAYSPQVPTLFMKCYTYHRSLVRVGCGCLSQGGVSRSKIN